MQVNYMTEEEYTETLLLSDGDYDFEVVEATDEVSKKGNEMIRVKLKVFTDDGGFRFIDDYLMEAMYFKLIHFCQATGLEETLKSGALVASDCEGKCAKVTIKTDPAGEYPAKNSVKDYVKPESYGKATETVATGALSSNELNDSIPF